jgi:hypothetical protein
MPWMRHPDIDGEPVRVNDTQFELLYEPRGWELTDRPLGFGETPASLPSEPLGPPPAPVDPDAMTRDDLIAEARKREVDVPSSATTKSDIAKVINDSATKPEES